MRCAIQWLTAILVSDAQFGVSRLALGALVRITFRQLCLETGTRGSDTTDA